MTKTEENREWRRKNPEKCAVNSKKYRQANLEKCKERERKYAARTKDKRAARARQRRAENPEREKIYNEVNRFAIPLYKSKWYANKFGVMDCNTTKQELKDSFTGFCFVCDEPEGKTKLHMDHDHKTGKFRGRLCKHCNHALGFVKDSPERLEKLLVYLQSQ